MKAKIIVWSVVGVLVLALLIALFMQPALISRFNVVLPGIGNTYDNANKYTAGNTSVSGVTALDVEWISGSVSIEAYDGDTVVLDERADTELPESQQVHWYLDGGILRVRFSKSGLMSFGFEGKHLTLKVPQNTQLTSVSVDAVSAETAITGIHADTFELETVSGALTLDALTGNTLDAETISGTLTGTQLSLREVDCDTTSGAQSLAFAGSVPANGSFQSVSGALALYLPEGSGFALEYDSVSGDFRSDFATTKNGDTYTSGDGAASLKAETVSGDIGIFTQH